MKCPSCKYENRYHYITTDRVVRYKSGKRKGEIKEVVKHRIELYENDPEFILLHTDQNDSFYYNEEFGHEHATLYACPKCGTVIVEELNKEC